MWSYVRLRADYVRLCATHIITAAGRCVQELTWYGGNFKNLKFKPNLNCKTQKIALPAIVTADCAACNCNRLTNYVRLCEITCKLSVGEAVEADLGDKGGELPVKTGGRNFRPRCFTSLWQRKCRGSAALLRFGKGSVCAVLLYFDLEKEVFVQCCFTSLW